MKGLQSAAGRLLNGEHAHRLERIEQRVDELHEKMEDLAAAGVENARNGEAA